MGKLAYLCVYVFTVSLLKDVSFRKAGLASLGLAGISQDWFSVSKRVPVVTVGTPGKLCGSDRQSLLVQHPSLIGCLQCSGHSFYKLPILTQCFSFTMTLKGGTMITPTLQMRKQWLSHLSEVT